MPAKHNRDAGAQFESLLVCRAGACGMKALKNELSFRYLPGGKIRPMRSDLDFRVLRQDGRIAYLDCKNFDAISFTYSQIDKHQLQRALAYEHWHVSAGFVVWLKPLRQVVFYSGQTLWRRGPGKRFRAEDGVALGDSYTFDLTGVFAATPTG